MSKVILGLLAGLALGAAITWTVMKHHEPGEETKPEEKTEESHVVHTNGQTFLKLDKEAQTHIGLKLAPAEAAVLKPEIKGYGRVLDPAPLAALLVESASARAALEASAREFERLKVLHTQDQNVSTRALESAEAAAKRDQILVQGVDLKLAATWGKSVASQPDLPAFIRSLAALETTLVRIDLSLGEALTNAPIGGRIAALSAADMLINAEFLGPAASADPQTQAQGFLFLLKKTPLLPGAAVVGWLTLPGEPEEGVLVPRSALVRHEGEVFVYVQVSDELFEKKEIELDHPLSGGWFVAEGLKKGERIVVSGAQQLLSEELKGEMGE